MRRPRQPPLHARHLWASMLLPIALAACAPASAPAPPVVAPQQPSPPLRRLEAPPRAPSTSILVVPPATAVGHTWILKTLRGQALLPGSHITMKIGNESMGGYDGCNWYGIRYREPPPGTIGGHAPIGSAESTAIGCSSDAVRLQVERYLAALRDTVELRRQGDTLTALDRNADTVLSFEREPRHPMQPAMLVGSGWRLESIDGQAHAHTAEQTITLRFGQQTLHGHAGCRGYSGEYQAQGDTIGVPSLRMLTTECHNKVALQREGAFTTLLSTVNRYHIQEDRLTLFTSTGHQAEFWSCPECAK